MQTRRIAVVLFLILSVALVAHSRSFSLHQSNNSLGMFTNETELDVNALILTFSEDVEIYNVAYIGGDMAITSDRGDFIILKGSLVPFGTILVEWASLDGLSLEAATWRTVPFAMHRIDIMSPTANFLVISHSEVLASDPSTHVFDFLALGSTDPDGEIVQYLWEWSDGVTATGSKVSRDFGELLEGEYVLSVTLTVIDNDGNTDSLRQSFTFVYIADAV